MEGLAVLSLTANIIQLLCACKDFVEVYNHIRKDLKPPDRNLFTSAAQVQTLSTSLLAIITQGGPNSSPELLAVLNHCNSTAGDIQTIVKKIDSQSNAVTKTLQTIRRRGSMEDLNKALDRHQQTLQTLLIEKIWTKQEAQHISQLAEFQKLDLQLQSFITLSTKENAILQRGINQDTAGLLARACQQLEDLIRSEGDANRQHMTRLHVSAKEEGRHQTAREIFHNSLYFDNLNERKNRIKENFPGTFEWIFKADDTDERSAFPHWMLSDEKIFWVSGKPGSGKSTLMKYLANDEQTLQLLSTKWPQSTIYDSFLIKNSSNILQRNTKGILCTLLYQILHENPLFVDTLLQDFPETARCRSIHDWADSLLLNVLRRSLQLHQTSVCLFIDGLDEIDNSDDPIELIKTIQSLTNTKADLKICVSSREETVFKNNFANVSSLQLQALTKDDIRQTAQDLIDRDLSRLDTDTKKFLLEELTCRASGVFLWLHLVLKPLRKNITSSMDELTVRRLLDKFPKDLDDLYAEMLSRADGVTSLERTALYLSVMIEWDMIEWNAWDLMTKSYTTFHMLLACNPELQNAILSRHGLTDLWKQAIARPLDKLNNLLEMETGGLLELGLLPDVPDVLDVPEMSITFIHRTARDFLTGTGTGRDLLNHCCLSKPPVNINTFKAELCKASVVQDSVEAGWDSMDKWSFGTSEGLNGVSYLLRHLINANTQLMTSSGTELCSLVRTEFERKSLSTFLESIAYWGGDKVLDLMLSTYDGTVPPDALWSYLMMNSSPFESSQVLNTTKKRSFLGPGGLITTSHANGPFFQVASIYEAWMADANYSMPATLESLDTELEVIQDWSGRSLYTYIERSESDMKLFDDFIYPDEPWMSYSRAGASRARAYGSAPWTEIIVEMSIAQMFNLSLLRYVSFGYTSFKEIDQRKRPSLECHQRILLLRHIDLDDPEPAFVEPTEEQSTTILKELQAPHFHSQEGDSLRKPKLAEIDNRHIRIHDIAKAATLQNKPVENFRDWLYEHGHFCPTETDIEPYLQGKTTDERALANDALVQRQVECQQKYKRRMQSEMP